MFEDILYAAKNAIAITASIIITVCAIIGVFYGMCAFLGYTTGTIAAIVFIICAAILIVRFDAK